MVWIVGLCLALQRHHGDHLLSLGVEDYSQGAQRSISMKEEIGVMVGEADRISRFEEHVIEEVRAQRVYTAMASSPPVVMKLAKTPVLALSLGAWLMPPLLSSS